MLIIVNRISFTLEVNPGILTAVSFGPRCNSDFVFGFLTIYNLLANHKYYQSSNFP